MTLYCGGVEEAWEGLWRHLGELRRASPLAPLEVLVPSRQDGAEVEAEAARRGLGGVLPVLFLDLADRRLGAGAASPSPTEERAALRRALASLGPDHPLAALSIPGRGGALAALLGAVARLAEWLPAHDPGHPEEESPALAACLAWRREWESAPPRARPAALRLDAARDSPVGTSPAAAWGVADLNTAQRDLVEPWAAKTEWFAPAPPPGAAGHGHLAPLAELAGGAETLGGGPVEVLWERCGDLLEVWLRAFASGRRAAAPAALADRAGLALAVVAGARAPTQPRPLAATRAGRLARMLAAPSMESLPRRAAAAGIEASGSWPPGAEEATRRLGVQRWGEDLSRIAKALGEGAPPRGLSDAGEWLEKLSAAGVEATTARRDPVAALAAVGGESAAALAAAAAEGPAALEEAAALDQAPGERGLPEGPLALRHAALRAGDPLVVLGATDDRLPGRLDRPSWQDHALEAHLDLPGPEDRLAEEAWRAWCLACPRKGEPPLLLWDATDERGEARFPSPLFPGRPETDPASTPAWPSGGPARRRRRRLARREGGDLSGAVFWSTGASDADLSLRVTSIRAGEPPCPFAHWAGQGGTHLPDPSGGMEPGSREIGTLFHLAVETLWRRLEAERGSDLPRAAAEAVARWRHWLPLGRQEAAEARVAEVAEALVREADRWLLAAKDPPDRVEAEWSPPVGSFGLPGLDGVFLRGRVDRVEVKGELWEMSDYKTGLAPRSGRPADLTQAALYPFARPDRPGEAEFVYRYPLESRAGVADSVRGSPAPGSRQGWETLRDALAAWRDAWRAGEREPRPGVHCEWCDWGGACRKRQWGDGAP